MTYHELVNELKCEYEKYDAGHITEHLAIQFNVTGEAEGALYLEIADGQIKIEPYEYYDRDILVTVSGENLLAVSKGSLKITDAVSTGILTAEGDLAKVLPLEEVICRKTEEKTIEKPEETTEETKPENSNVQATKKPAQKATPKRYNKKRRKKK